VYYSYATIFHTILNLRADKLRNVNLFLTVGLIPSLINLLHDVRDK